MGTFLNEDSILQYLSDTVDHLKAGRVDQSEMALEILEFERLLRPIRSGSRDRRIIDPALPFGRERVYETGEHIRACQDDIRQNELTAALVHAEAALARWKAGR